MFVNTVKLANMEELDFYQVVTLYHGFMLGDSNESYDFKLAKVQSFILECETDANALLNHLGETAMNTLAYMN